MSGIDDLTPLHDGMAYCRERIDLFNAEVLAFAQSNVELHKQTSPPHHERLFATLAADVPVAFARDAGLILNETRAQLDHLANVLGARNGANEPDASYPILSDASKLTREARKRVRQLSQADQDLIWKLQPYADEATWALPVLHAIDIFRKHHAPLGARVVITTSVRGGGSIGTLSQAQGQPPLLRAGDSCDVAYLRDVTMEVGGRCHLEIVEPAEFRGQSISVAMRDSLAAVEHIVSHFV